MSSGIYIVTLNNDELISVNAHDPRVADKAIKVNRANIKVGRARNLEARKKNYFKTFGKHNVNFNPVALIDDFMGAEKEILAKLNEFRIRGRTGRKNEWLQDISYEQALEIVLNALEESEIPIKVLV